MERKDEMSNDKYILDGHKPVKCDDLFAWAKWFDDINKRRVKETKVGRYRISTVFLGLDHNFGEDGPPVLFETMVFDNEGERWRDLASERYSTWDEAERGHDKLVDDWKQNALH
jgi:hypothetical protein